MGTRSLTFVYTDQYEEKCEPIINMYRQFDGYPEGHGIDLAIFLKSFEAVTNGIRVGETRKTANGMGCLAAQMVANFKTGVGGFYLYPVTAKDCGQEYEYHVYSDRVTVYGWDHKHLFTGPWSAFEAWCRKGQVDYTTEEGQEELRNVLRLGEATVTFIKKDGSERVMRCTLKPEVIGESTTTSTGGRANSGEACAVYDLDANGWRSFRYDSIVSVE